METAERIASYFARIPFFGSRAIYYYIRRRYAPRVITKEKVKNIIRCKTEMTRKAVTVNSLPYLINLDTMNRCNLRCPFCPTGTNQLDRKKTRMPLQQVKQVIDKVKPQAVAIRLYNWGEPFVNPDIFEIIRYAHEARLYSIVSTNISVQIKNLGEKVIDSKLDSLNINIDGLEQRTLEKYRKGADLKLMLNNTREIIQIRKKKGSSKPRVSLWFHVFRHNEHESSELKKLGAELGVDSTVVRKSFVYVPTWKPRNPRFQIEQTLFSGICDFLYSELTIEADGGISPCCTNTSQKWNVGTTDDLDDLGAVWNNSQFRAMRAFNAGWNSARLRAINGGKKTLCHYCRLVARPGWKPQDLSPLPPSFSAEGVTYNHGLDMN